MPGIKNVKPFLHLRFKQLSITHATYERGTAAGWTGMNLPRPLYQRAFLRLMQIRRVYRCNRGRSAVKAVASPNVDFKVAAC